MKTAYLSIVMLLVLLLLNAGCFGGVAGSSMREPYPVGSSLRNQSKMIIHKDYVWYGIIRITVYDSESGKGVENIKLTWNKSRPEFGKTDVNGCFEGNADVFWGYPLSGVEFRSGQLSANRTGPRLWLIKEGYCEVSTVIPLKFHKSDKISCVKITVEPITGDSRRIKSVEYGLVDNEGSDNQSVESEGNNILYDAKTIRGTLSNAIGQ